MSEWLARLSEFAAMGGDGAHVWSAYGITLAAMLWNIWSAGRRHRRSLERAGRDGSVGAERPARTPKVRQVQ